MDKRLTATYNKFNPYVLKLYPHISSRTSYIFLRTYHMIFSMFLLQMSEWRTAGIMLSQFNSPSSDGVSSHPIFIPKTLCFFKLLPPLTLEICSQPIRIFGAILLRLQSMDRRSFLALRLPRSALHSAQRAVTWQSPVLGKTHRNRMLGIL